MPRSRAATAPILSQMQPPIDPSIIDAATGRPLDTAEAPAGSRLRVLFVLNSLCVGGAEKHVVSLINRLDRRRFAISLVYLKREEQLLAQLDVAACEDGLHCLDVAKGVDWTAIGRLSRHIDERRIDIVVCTNMYALLYGWLARVRSRRSPKMVEVFHTTDLGSRKERLSMLLYKPLVGLCDLMVYVCQGQARQWQAAGMRARQDTVIYNGIDTTRFVDEWSAADKLDVRRGFGFESTDYVVGLCAVLRPEKAHGDLVAAAAILRDRGMSIKVLLIGDGPERARVEAQAKSSGLSEHVVITGFIQDVRPVIAACDVMVLASHAVETFSLAALEAMALGKPMVMTQIGGATEQVTSGENGILFGVGDTLALVDALNTLSVAGVRQRMGHEAALRVRARFGVGTMVRGFEQALAAVADGRRVEEASAVGNGGAAAHATSADAHQPHTAAAH